MISYLWIWCKTDPTISDMTKEPHNTIIHDKHSTEAKCFACSTNVPSYECFSKDQATPIAKISHRGLHWLIWTWLWCHCGGLFRCFNWIGKNHGPWRLESWIFKIQQSFWHMFSDIGDPITSFTWWPNPGGRVSPPGAGDFMLDFFFLKFRKMGPPR